MADLLVPGLEEGWGTRAERDVEGKPELRVVEADPLAAHRLDDVEAERPHRKVVRTRPQRPREADVPLLSLPDDAGVAVHHVRVRVQAQAAEDVHTRPVEREVVAVVVVGVRGRRDVDRSSRLVERVVVEGVQAKH